MFTEVRLKFSTSVRAEAAPPRCLTLGFSRAFEALHIAFIASNIVFRSLGQRQLFPVEAAAARQDIFTAVALWWPIEEASGRAVGKRLKRMRDLVVDPAEHASHVSVPLQSCGTVNAGPVQEVLAMGQTLFLRIKEDVWEEYHRIQCTHGVILMTDRIVP